MIKLCVSHQGSATVWGHLCTIFPREPCLIDVKNNQQFQTVIPLYGCKKNYFQQGRYKNLIQLFHFSCLTLPWLFSFFMFALHSHLTWKYSLFYLVCKVLTDIKRSLLNFLCLSSVFIIALSAVFLKLFNLFNSEWQEII